MFSIKMATEFLDKQGSLVSFISQKIHDTETEEDLNVIQLFLKQFNKELNAADKLVNDKKNALKKLAAQNKNADNIIKKINDNISIQRTKKYSCYVRNK